MRYSTSDRCAALAGFYYTLERVVYLNQEEHHKKSTFKKDYIDLLETFEVEYEDDYLFSFVE
jgi:hypothetical protein